MDGDYKPEDDHESQNTNDDEDYNNEADKMKEVTMSTI